jgi:hypothetical protein
LTVAWLDDPVATAPGTDLITAEKTIHETHQVEHQ